MTGDMLKEGAVVIDCGINPIPDATKKSGQRLVSSPHPVIELMINQL